MEKFGLSSITSRGQDTLKRGRIKQLHAALGDVTNTVCPSNALENGPCYALYPATVLVTKSLRQLCKRFKKNKNESKVKADKATLFLLFDEW